MKITALLTILVIFMLPLGVQAAATQTAAIDWQVQLIDDPPAFSAMTDHSLTGFSHVTAATRAVDTLVDEADGSCSDGDCSLRDAINLSAAVGDIIQFSVNGTITLTGVLSFNKGLTITGPGPDKLTLDGDNQYQVMYLSGDSTKTVSISGLTIANGSSGGSFGGGIRNYNIMGGPHLVLDQMIFSHNLSGGDGGAVFSQGELTITNSRFDSNTAHNGGAIRVSFHNADISGSVFTNNQANNDDAGAVYATGNGLPIIVNITNCTFTGNKAPRFGGAIRLDSYSTTTITRSLFTSNAVDYGTFNSQGIGGAIYNNGSLVIISSAFIANQAGTDSTTNNRAGAIYTYGPLDITNSTFYNNKVRASGGALYIEGSSGTRTITNSTLYGNDLLGPGNSPAIFNSVSVTVKNTIIGGPSNNNCGGVGFSASSSNNLATDGSCGASFTNVTPEQLNLSWIGWYLLPKAGSVAIDAGTNTGCPAVDQRGWARPVDGDGAGGAVCDVGAIEATPVFVQVYLPLIVR